MPLQGNLIPKNRYAFTICGSVKTVLGESGYDVKNCYNKAISVYNGATGSFVSGVVEVSNDKTHWATLVGIGGGSLAPSTLWNYNTKDSWRYIKLSAALYAGSAGATIAGSNGTVLAWIIF
jgi:hypothetical protein